MKSYTAVIERDAETGLYVGYVPGFRGAHSQASSLKELQANLAEVVGMLLEDGEPHLDAEFVGTQTVVDRWLSNAVGARVSGRREHNSTSIAVA